jgi:hypothetical protein
MGTVRVENHFYPEGEEFDMPGLGRVINFQDVEVDEVQIAEYKGQGFAWPEDGNLKIVVAEPEFTPPSPPDPNVLTPSEQLAKDIAANDQDPRMEDAGGRISGDVAPPADAPAAPVVPSPDAPPADVSTTTTDAASAATGGNP